MITVITQFLLQTTTNNMLHLRPTFPHVVSITGVVFINLANLSSYFGFEESKYQLKKKKHNTKYFPHWLIYILHHSPHKTHVMYLANYYLRTIALVTMF